MAVAPQVPRSESLGVLTVKVLMYVAAAVLMLDPLATRPGLVAAIVGICGAALVARRMHRRGLRTVAGVVLGVGAMTVAWLVSDLFRDNAAIAGALGVDGAIITSDIIFFGVALGAALFVVRLAAHRSRVVTVLEAALIIFSVVYTFARHRNYHLNQPRWFSDLTLSEGYEPTSVLMIMGIAIMVLALVMFMRRQSGAKTVLSMLIAIGVGVGVYFLIGDKHIDADVLTNGLGLTDDDQGGKGDEESDGGSGNGQGGSGGGSGDGPSGGGKGPYSDNYDQNDKPQPVAVVTFHDDYEAKEGILYFRQQVQSAFNQTHLQPDTSGDFDADVIQAYPTTGPVAAGPSQNLDIHKPIPTSMFLLADHPQPVALTHSTELRPLDNPNPRVFVAAYEVTSHALSVDYSRLLGRRSVPDSWSEEQRRHYLEIPDDPRYSALSDILVRDLDPRFGDEDLMKALAIKRYLETQGFYTRKETHTDNVDPTASFLFGSMRGYCVHFAHSAAFLFRSQGIASRVAVGYAADTTKRSGGSNLLILGSQAHAWPEIHLDGIGWVTFDIYPEQSDEPPPRIIDQDLESVLGEMARKDSSGGRAEDISSASGFPWAALGWITLTLLLTTLVCAYGVKVARRLMPAFAKGPGAHRWALRAALDRFADIGHWRHPGETRERFAERMAEVTPSLRPLTMAHLRAALGAPGRAAGVAGEVRTLYAETAREYRAGVPVSSRVLGLLNPIGWWFTR